MSLNSFRVKIALLSGLIIGLLLVGSGAILWQRTYRIELARIDRELRNLGAPHLERVLGGDHWVRLESALRFVAGTNDAPSFILWVRNEDRVVHQSTHWPAGVDPEALPPLIAYEGAGGPPPGQPLPPPPRRGEEISPRNPALPRKAPHFLTRVAEGRPWRLGVMGNPYATLVLGVDINEFNAGMAQLKQAYLAALLAALALASLGAWYLAQRALRPVEALARMAERVTARGLNQRIPTMPRDQEFNRLVVVFNEMLDRLEASFRQANRFSADASHELKTPLARLQIELEQALENTPSGSPEQEVFSSLLDEISRLKAIVQKLLLLSLADAGRLRLHLEPVELSRILENILEDGEAQAPHLTLEHELAPDLHVQADPDLLEQALQNLVTNAIKYNQERGRIRIASSRVGDRVEIRIANTGPGIPAADRDRIFERFYRADESRSHRVEGVGLGLSLSREILRAHAGDLSLEKVADHAEPLNVFLAWLPASPAMSGPLTT